MQLDSCRFSEQDFTGVLYRVWPGYTTTWFVASGRSSAPVPNNFRDLDTSEKLHACKEAVRSYLDSLLGFSTPSRWLDEDQFERLFEELKHLVGETSASQGGGGRNLTLGTAALLLLAASGPAAKSMADEIYWAGQTDEVLPKQTQSQSQSAIGSLVKLMKCLTMDPISSISLVERIDLRVNSLRICLNIDLTRSRRPDQLSVFEMVTQLVDASGQTFDCNITHAYREFLMASSKSQRGGREARSVINLLPVESHVASAVPTNTLLEIISCH